jgi:hypothetical protein
MVNRVKVAAVLPSGRASAMLAAFEEDICDTVLAVVR